MRRAGGSLSPGAIVRVGGGGSLLLPRGLLLPRDLRSEMKSVGEGVLMIMLWRAGREGGGNITSGISSGVGRREGRGGGLLGVGVELAEELRLFSFPARRGRGGGGTVRLGREGSLRGGEMLATLSLELLMLSECPREWRPRRVIAGGSDISELSHSSSEKGLCLDEQLELALSGKSSPVSKRTER